MTRSPNCVREIGEGQVACRNMTTNRVLAASSGGSASADTGRTSDGQRSSPPNSESIRISGVSGDWRAERR
jgi:hypothetical protein